MAVITQRVTQGMQSQAGVAKIYLEYSELFGTNKPMLEQFILYIKNVAQGNFGTSFSQYPRSVADIIKSAIGWTICLQFPAIIVGWLIGNTLGALAAYLKGGFDKVIMPISIFVSNFPAFGMAIILQVVFATTLKWFPISGGYGFDQIPNLSWKFVWSVIVHYQLPFWSIVLISIGGQAIGMRSMSIYELNADYVKYSRFLGIKDRKIVGYVFRNAMLPQVTGLALSIGTMVGGALVAEIIFSYPGLGNTILKAVVGQDYPLISGVTLIITLMVLSANFIIEIVYGIIDPRIKATQAD
ncbi:MAG TPA: ABC transporter permease [Anaerolineales bacterium]|nr:ABC transporter permease [Anaerolineales bacterium]